MPDIGFDIPFDHFVSQFIYGLVGIGCVLGSLRLYMWRKKL